MSHPVSTQTPPIACSPIIGRHCSPLSQKFGTPRQPNLVAVPSRIEMYAPYHIPEAFSGIEEFSHIWITWQTHHNRQQTSFKPLVRPPRLGGNTKLGVFATRSTYRPSQLGISVVKLLHVEVTQAGSVVLHITGADMVDGTPIIDIKPYVGYSDAIIEAVSGFASEKPTHQPVSISHHAQTQFDVLVAVATSEPRLLESDIDIICQLIAQDPRPAYKKSDTRRVYAMRYKQVDVIFQIKVEKNVKNTLEIVAVQQLL